MVAVQPAGWQEPEEDEQALESSEVEVRSLVVGVTQHGVRLALAELVPELSRKVTAAVAGSRSGSAQWRGISQACTQGQGG